MSLVWMKQAGFCVLLTQACDKLKDTNASTALQNVRMKQATNMLLDIHQMFLEARQKLKEDFKIVVVDDILAMLKEIAILEKTRTQGVEIIHQQLSNKFAFREWAVMMYDRADPGDTSVHAHEGSTDNWFMVNDAHHTVIAHSADKSLNCTFFEDNFRDNKSLKDYFDTSAATETKTICFNDGTVTLAGCNCTEQWTGESCQEYKCVNGLSAGTNYDPHSTFFNSRCICDIGWTGELCNQSTIDKCNGHGKSIKNQCICDEFYIGEHCESVDKCVNGQHWNGRCSCFYGFSGDFCDTIVCNAGKPDHQTNDTICICDSNFRGRFCDFCLHDYMTFPDCSVDSVQVRSSRKCSAEVNFYPLLVGVLLCSAIIILVSFAFFFWQRKQRRSRLQQLQAIEEKEVMI